LWGKGTKNLITKNLIKKKHQRKREKKRTSTSKLLESQSLLFISKVESLKHQQ